MRSPSVRDRGRVCRALRLLAAVVGVGAVGPAAWGQPTNDECSTAISLDCGTVTVANNLGATPNPTDPTYSCAGGAPGSNTLWYSFIATDTSARVSACTSPSSAPDSLLAVYSGTCGSLVELACSDDACGQGGLQAEVCVNGLTIGVEYLVQLAAFGTADAGPFNLILECPCPGPCDITCDPGKTLENEANCGLPSDTVNGGCFATPAVFSPIVCGESYCSTQASGDLDWYRVVLANDAVLSWTVTSEAPAVIGIINTGGDDDCGSIAGFLVTAVTNPCMVSTATVQVGPGTWYLYVATLTGGVPCGAEYNATLTCEPATRNFDLPGSDPLDPITDPLGGWHELWPNFCNNWTCDEWDDNGSGVLDPCDYLHMTKDATTDEQWYHVVDVTITLTISPKPELIVQHYVDYTGNDIAGAMANPVGTPWQEILPPGFRDLVCIGWNDNGDSVISTCDQITFQDPVTGFTRVYHVEAVATDIDVVEEDPPPPPPCPADCALNDGFVDVSDLLALLAQWGGPGACDIANIVGEVEVGDLLALLAAWGNCPD